MNCCWNSSSVSGHCHLCLKLWSCRFIRTPFASNVEGLKLNVLFQVVKDPFLRRLIDLECFVLSGLLADRCALCWCILPFLWDSLQSLIICKRAPVVDIEHSGCLSRLRRYLDAVGFVWCSTITAEMVTMFKERHRKGGSIDYPLGGGGSIIEALTRGLEKHGGRLLLRSHVDEILLEGGCAVG
jgi:hypothetical protein